MTAKEYVLGWNAAMRGDKSLTVSIYKCPTLRCSNMTLMYKVVKTVTSTKLRHEPFQDFYEVHEEIGRYEGISCS